VSPRWSCSLLALACLLSLATSAWSQVPPHLADSWAKCQEQAKLRSGRGSRPGTPRRLSITHSE
jgi:hypothetical protein